MQHLTTTTGAAAIVGNAAADVRATHVDLYNAASVFAPDGALLVSDDSGNRIWRITATGR